MSNMDVDHGYSWIILIFCGIVYMFIIGSVKSFGVVYTELLDHYDTGAGSTAWISSLSFLLLMGLGPVSNYLGERFTYRVVMVIGSCFLLIGYTASAFVTRMEMFYLTYGIITGIGYGLIFAPCTTIISFYFKKRRSLANGLMVSFSGIGNLAFPYMYRYLFDLYGLHGAFMVIGAILFHVSAASMFLRQPVQPLKSTKTTEERTYIFKKEEKLKVSLGILHQAIMRMCKVDLFRIPKYTIILLAMFFQIGNYAGNLVVLPGQIRSLQLGKDVIVICISIVGATEMLSRAFLGWFADLHIIKRTNLFMICGFFSAVIAFCMPHLPYKTALIAYAVLMGTFSGSIWSMIGVLIVDCVGIDNFSPAFGLVLMICALSMFIAQPASGWLEDLTGNWNMSFRFLGLLSTLSFVLCLSVPMVERWWCCDKETKSDHLKEEKNNLEEIGDIAEKNVLLNTK